jgi:anti-anti-sigma factor
VHTLTPSPVPAGGPGILEVSVERHDGVAVVVLRGPLDIYTTPGFRTRLEPLAGSASRLVVDLTGVTILDSSGLGALLRLRNRMGAGVATRFGIVCPRRRMRRIFDITGLRPAFVMERDLADVLRAWEAADVA